MPSKLRNIYREYVLHLDLKMLWTTLLYKVKEWLLVHAESIVLFALHYRIGNEGSGERPGREKDKQKKGRTVVEWEPIALKPGTSRWPKFEYILCGAKWLTETNLTFRTHCFKEQTHFQMLWMLNVTAATVVWWISGCCSLLWSLPMIIEIKCDKL